MSFESWRMSRTELRDLLNKYEKAVEDDASALLRPTDAERKALGDEVFGKRLEALRKARDVNRRFVEAVVDDLPDLCAGPLAEASARPVMQFRELPSGTPTLPASSYGSMASVFLHLLRDWSTECEHVYESTYLPVVTELKKLLPEGEVLVPGAGLARLAVVLAAEGYKVEANEGSRLFLTFADYMLNRAPAASCKIFPLAHVFSENFNYGGQYVEIAVPDPAPKAIASKEAAQSAQLPVAMMPGDFVKTYAKGGPGYRKFNAIVSCFFLDTVTDIVELVEVLDDLLEEGGVWINVGPLNWKREARLKLNWEEMVALWKGRGYEFVTESSVDTDYHLRRGVKMYTESYKCALTAAVKRRPSRA